MEIIWTQTALKQFQEAAIYTQREYGDKVAENFKSGVIETINPLEEHPQKGALDLYYSTKNGNIAFYVTKFSIG